ncbi:MAG: hypothetical protein H6838_03445 [Planctomycetes bacterium]|nr:hypothetical protein [Planctomycetota bacterium]MCB9884518.1 hypothetical protein [Planctomycetota bacterium]
MNSLPAVLALGACLFAQLPAQSTTAVVASDGFAGARMCYDEARQRLVFNTPSGAIWEWDGVSWARSLVTAVGGQSAYDPARQRVFIAGTELYEYDGASAVSRGPCVGYSQLIADASRARLIGIRPNSGVTQGVAIDEYDGTGWSQVASIAGLRIGIAGAFDRLRGVTVLQVLQISPAVQYETWEWDGVSLTGPSVDGIPRAIGAWDATRQQVVAIGSGSTWTWNGTAWSQLSSGALPTSASSIASDPANGRIWLFSNSPQYRAKLWLWDGGGWSEPLDAPHPPILQPNLTYDSVRGRAVLLGVLNDPSGGAQHSEWDGLRWTRVAAATMPPTFQEHGQVFDAARGETVVFGGTAAGVPIAETWAYDGNTWRLAANTGPSARFSPAMAFDAGRGVVVLCGGRGPGGVNLTDHWEWDGTSWTMIAAATPMAPEIGVLGYDPLRARLVFQGNFGSTFEYNGAAWQLVASGGPVFSGANSLVWNPGRQRLQATLYQPSQPFRFEWDGAVWSQTSDPVGELAYDAQRDAMLCYDTNKLLVDSASPAVAGLFGAGCGGTATVTSLMPFGAPRWGDARFHLDVRADATQRPVILGFGLGSGSVSLGNGCTFLLQNSFGSRVWFTDQAGFMHQPLPLPNSPVLRGFLLNAQAAVLDPVSPGGFAMTQGLSLTIGD